MKRTALSGIFLFLSALPAGAHGEAGLTSGFLHPFFGADHIVAMVAVGIWSASAGGRTVWALPLSFIGAMIAGGLAAGAGLAFPFVETAIIASAIVLGLLAFGRVRLPLWPAMAITGLFALAHGHAHGTEMPAAADPAIYAAGFAAATALLHLAGILIAWTWPARRSAHV